MGLDKLFWHYGAWRQNIGVRFTRASEDGLVGGSGGVRLCFKGCYYD